MRFFRPELALGILLPPQEALEDKFGGLPWGLAPGRWPKCAECGKPMTHLAQLIHHAERLDLGADGRVAVIFQCNGGSCSSWDQVAGANTVLIIEAAEVGQGLANEPEAETPFEAEARVRTWHQLDDGISPENFAKFFADAEYTALSSEIQSLPGLESRLAGTPSWLQNPSEAPKPPFRFAGQFDSTHRFAGPVPPARQVHCTITRKEGDSYRHEQPKWPFWTTLLGAGKDKLTQAQNLGRPRQITVSEDGSYLCDAANYGDAGIGYLFVNPDTASPKGRFFWQCL
jgi:hypothetical protein